MTGDTARNARKSATGTYYDLLGLPEIATKSEIKAAYHRLISKYHPDKNPGNASAAEMTVRLNEAYSVLSDEAKRSLYDSWRKATRVETPAPTNTREEPAEAVPDICCSKCGRQDSTLRLALMYYVISLIVVTYRRGASGIWCDRCRAIESFKWSFLSGLLGWWGFPWGPIYTVQALFVNASGGSRPNDKNAILLRVVGFQLYAKGQYGQALRALRESLKLEINPEAAALERFLTQQGGQQSQENALWRVAAAVPTIAVVSVIATVWYAIASGPSGYAAHYTPANRAGSISRAGIGEAKAGDPHRSHTNEQVAKLARIVEARAPIVGTHYEGTKRIRDHVLDRSKFDAQELYGISTAISQDLKFSGPDSDGFLASAYFNAAIFAASVDIENSLAAGRNIRQPVKIVEGLGKHPQIAEWLEGSQYYAPYGEMLDRLHRYESAYHPVVSAEELAQQIKEQRTRLKRLKTRLEELESTNEAAEYNALIPTYNSLVANANAVIRRYRIQTDGVQKLDLAFNRCLDKGILLSNFDTVDLASHAADIAAIPEPDKP